MLLRSLFSDPNSKARILKLLGDVKVFYRKASLPKVITHKKGSILVNKKDMAGNPIDSDTYLNLYEYFNKCTSNLLPEAKKLLDDQLVVYKTAKYDIIKDKRFTEDQLSVHFPVSINYRSPSRDYDFNKDFRQLIKNSDLVNILSVHLGEENLAEIAIIDPYGKILYRKNYSEFNNYNYAKAISSRKESRIEAQKNWLQMEKIKNLRMGFMGHLINEICKLVLEFNAVIVLEDFSLGKTRRKRPPFSMQFAINLLRKLNYLVLKDKEPLEPGGILNGYQLAPKVDSLSSFANQIGCVFFVLPEYQEENLFGQDYAYNLALKGSILINRIKETISIDRVDLAIKKKDWQAFLDNHNADN